MNREFISLFLLFDIYPYRVYNDVKEVNVMNCCSHKKTERTDEEKKNLITRLNRVIGQLNGIKKMIEEDRYCDDILIQLSASDKSIKAIANIVLERHMHSCLIDNIKNDNYEVIDEIVDLFKRFQ